MWLRELQLQMCSRLLPLSAAALEQGLSCDSGASYLGHMLHATVCNSLGGVCIKALAEVRQLAKKRCC